MKIGILTLPFHVNYGGILQAWALYNTLHDLGHDVYILRVVEKPQNKLKNFLKKQKRDFCKNIWDIFPNKNGLKEKLKDSLEIFLKRERVQTLYFYNSNDLINFGLQAIVVGSDQVWRRTYTDNIKLYYLDFAENLKLKKISYGASFGVNYWEYNDKDTSECKKLLGKFDAISVREDSGIELCRKYLGKKADLVLDPVLLISPQRYKKIAQRVETSKHFILSYILDRTKQIDNISKRISKILNLPIQNVNCLDSECKLKNLYIKYPLEYWIASNINCDYILTDSFHGCVLSIVFNKPFLVLDNAKRGSSRFTSLLKLFGLEDRLIQEESEIGDKLFDKINWTFVNIQLKHMRSKSLFFLQNNLR